MFFSKWTVKGAAYAAKLRTSMSIHNDQEYGKNIMTPHEIIDRDKGAKMLII